MPFCVIEPDANCLLIGFNRFIIAANPSVSSAQIPMYSSLLGVDAKGLFVRLNGLFVLSKFGQTISDLEIPRAMVRVSLDRLNKIGKSLLIILCPQETKPGGVKSFCRGKPVFYSTFLPLRKRFPLPHGQFCYSLSGNGGVDVLTRHPKQCCNHL